MKVLIVSPSLQGGGAERVAVDIANGFSTIGDSVTLLTHEVDGVYRQELEEDVEIKALKFKKTVFNFLFIAKYFEHEKIDIAVSTQSYVGLTIWLAAFFSRKKVRVVVRESSTPSKNLDTSGFIKLFIVKHLIAYVLNRSDLVIAPCEFVKSDMQEFYKTRLPIHVFYNPVNVPSLLNQGDELVEHPWFGEEQSIPTMVAVGRLEKVKNYPFLFDCIKQNLLDGFSIRLLVLGEGSLRKELEEIVSENSLKDNVDFLGFQKNPFKFIKNSNLLALVSEYEGYPNVLIQSRILGAPAIALASCGGVKEILPKDNICPELDVTAFSSLIKKTILEKSTGQAPELNLMNVSEYASKIKSLVFKEV